MQFAILKGVYGTRRKMQESQCMSVREQVYKVLLDSRMNRPALRFLAILERVPYTP